MGIDMITLIGAGGHAKVVVDALLLRGTLLSEIALRDGNIARDGVTMMGVTIACPELSPLLKGKLVHFALGDCALRAKLLGIAQAMSCVLETILHPAAMISPFAEVGDGTFAAAGSIVAPFARVGASVIINHGAVVDHDCVIGDCSHVAPNATLGGGVTIGAGVLVGSGSTVLPGIKVGNGAIIGGGAVVTKDVAPGELRIGVPCRKSSL